MVTAAAADTGEVSLRVTMVAIGPFWVAGGLVMAMSPPLEGRRGEASPALGAAIVVLAVVMMAVGIKQMVARRERQPRHSRGERDPRGIRVFGIGGAVTALMGGFCLWEGVNASTPALAGLGVITLSASAFAIPLVKDSLGVRKH